MPISDWAELFPFTVTHRAPVGLNEYGKPEYDGAATEYAARIVENPSRIASRVTGDDVVSMTQIWILGVIDPITIYDEIVLPDGRKPIILNWATYPDENGNHHTKLYVQHANQPQGTSLPGGGSVVGGPNLPGGGGG